MFFAYNTLTPSANGENCYDRELAFATPHVKNILHDFIDHTPSHLEFGNSWKRAFEKAFDYLSTSDTRRTYKTFSAAPSTRIILTISFVSGKSIFFLTDGEYDPREADDIVDTIRAWNQEKTNYDTLILTYDLHRSGLICIQCTCTHMYRYMYDTCVYTYMCVWCTTDLIFICMYRV